ncbi:MAG: exodeoxyribonuclease VII small subunit [Bacteroidales bacterium]
MKKTQSYTKAFQELEVIVNEMETAQIEVDELTNKLKRAGELIKICKDKLSDTEEEVANILKNMD